MDQIRVFLPGPINGFFPSNEYLVLGSPSRYSIVCVVVVMKNIEMRIVKMMMGVIIYCKKM